MSWARAAVARSAAPAPARAASRPRSAGFRRTIAASNGCAATVRREERSGGARLPGRRELISPLPSSTDGRAPTGLGEEHDAVVEPQLEILGGDEQVARRELRAVSSSQPEQAFDHASVSRATIRQPSRRRRGRRAARWRARPRPVSTSTSQSGAARRAAPRSIALLGHHARWRRGEP